MLQLSLLGPIRVQSRTGHPIRIKSQKALALLAYLHVERTQRHTRQALADLFWPDHLERSARNNLRQTLFRLRKAMASLDCAVPLLQLEGDVVALHNEWVTSCDVDQFNSLAVSPQDSPRARALYRGSFMAQISLAGATGFEQWLIGQRSRLRQQLITHLQAEINACQRGQNFGAALTLAEQWRALAPFDEQGLRAELALLATLDRRGQALREAHAMRQRFQHEMGVQFGAETNALIGEIAAGGGQLRMQIHQQPAGTLTFTPNAPWWSDYVRQIEQIFDRTEEPVVQLVGPAGCGKTALARAIQQRSHAQRRAIYIRHHSTASPLLQAELETLLQQQPAAQVLITTEQRQPLLTTLCVYVDGLKLSSDQLLSPAAHFLRDALRRDTKQTTPPAPHQLNNLALAVDGQPWLLERVAQLLPQQEATQLLATIQSDPSMLWQTDAASYEQWQIAFQRRWAGLPARIRIATALLANLPQPLPQAVAATICADHDTSTQALRDNSLLIKRDQQWSVPLLIRQALPWTDMVTPTAQTDSQRVWLAATVGTFEAVIAQLDGADQLAAFATLQAQQSDWERWLLLAAQTGQWAALAAQLPAWVSMCTMSGSPQRGIALCEACLAESPPRDFAALFGAAQAYLQHQLGQTKAAYLALNHAPENSGWHDLWLAEIHTQLGLYDQAQTHLQRALGWAQAAGNTVAAATVVQQAGVVAWRRGDAAMALQHVEQSQRLFASRGVVWQRLRTARLRAQLATARDDQQQAIRHFRQAVQIAEMFGNQHVEALIRRDWALALAASNEFALADELLAKAWQQGAAVALDTGRLVRIASLRANLARQTGRYHDAIRHLLTALQYGVQQQCAPAVTNLLQQVNALHQEVDSVRAEVTRQARMQAQHHDGYMVQQLVDALFRMPSTNEQEKPQEITRLVDQLLHPERMLHQLSI